MTTRAEKSSKGWTLSGTQALRAVGPRGQRAADPGARPEGPSLFLVDPSAAGLKLSPVQGMDLATRWVHLELDKVPVAGDAVLGAPGQAAPLARSALLRRGAVGAAAEMLGAARRCLDMAVGYAKVREQFGQPIGSFQAIRHKCAEMLLEVENSLLGRVLRGLGARRAGGGSRARGVRSRRPTSPTRRARSAARRSRCTAASASPGSTTCTSTSSAPRRSSRCTATSTTTASRSSGAPRGSRSEHRPVSTPPPPLDGVKIVDLTSYIAGSYAAMQLADLGRGGHQGRGARGRLVPRAARLLRLESRQALARRQPQDARRPPDRPPARRGAPTSSVENMRPGCRRASGRRLRPAERDQPAAHLFLGHGVRLERTRLRPARLRSGLSGAGRPDDLAGLRRVRRSICGPLQPTTTRRRWRPRASCRRSSRASGPGGASAWRPRCCAACWRSRRACAIDYPSKPTVDSRQPDLSPLSGGRRHVVLPRRSATRRSG